MNSLLVNISSVILCFNSTLQEYHCRRHTKKLPSNRSLQVLVIVLSTGPLGGPEKEQTDLSNDIYESEELVIFYILVKQYEKIKFRTK